MSDHILNKYGTTRCPVERVAANVDDGDCSACGATVNDQPDTLTARTEALNRVAAENDRLRATLTRVERLAFQWSEKADDAELMAISRKGLSDEPGLRAFATVMRRRAAEISVALEGP